MNRFGKRSLNNLNTAHPDLVRLFTEVLKGWNCSILCGTRSEDEQNKMYQDGKSKLKYPQSRHNTNPSNAVDVAPWPIDWNDIGRFYMFAGYVMCVAERLGIDVRYGGDWDGDKRTADQTFNDLPHWELKK